MNKKIILKFSSAVIISSFYGSHFSIAQQTNKTLFASMKSACAAAITAAWEKTKQASATPAKAHENNSSNLISPLDIVSPTATIQELIVEYLGESWSVKTNFGEHVSQLVFLTPTLLAAGTPHQSIELWDIEHSNVKLKKKLIDVTAQSQMRMRNVFNEPMRNSIMMLLAPTHNKLIAGYSDGTVAIWNSESMHVERPTLTPRDFQFCYHAYSPTFASIITANLGHGISIWNRKFEERIIGEGHNVTVKISPDGNNLLYGAEGKLHLYNLTTNTDVVLTIENNIYSIHGIGWLSDTIIICAYSTVKQAHWQDYNCLLSVWDITNREQPQNLRKFESDVIIHSIDALTNKTQFIALSGSLMQLWNAFEGTKKILAKTQSPVSWSTALSPNDQYIAASPGYGIRLFENTAQTLRAIIKAKKEASKKINAQNCASASLNNLSENKK